MLNSLVSIKDIWKSGLLKKLYKHISFNNFRAQEILRLVLLLSHGANGFRIMW